MLLAERLDPPDLDEGPLWLTRAAEAGHTYAQFELGRVLAWRLDPPDLDGGRAWLNRAAGVSTQRHICPGLARGGLDPPDLDGARAWYTKAAVAGHIEAQFNLGQLFAERLDPPDLDGARTWLTRAAEAGHTDAQYELGVLLATAGSARPGRGSRVVDQGR